MQRGTMKLFIFGSTGDLVKRKILPAIQNLERKDLYIWALGRRDFTHEIYSDFACEGRCSVDFKKRIFYKKIDLEKKDMCDDCIKIFDKDEINYFYVSLPPELVGNVLESVLFLKRKGIKVRILIEKPFGRDLNEAEKLRKIIEDNFSSSEVYLSDHYMFKDEIIGLKKTDFRKLRIVSLESVGLEHRRTYYDTAGALKDMVQSHFINIAFKIGGEINPEEMKIVKFDRLQYGNGADSGYAKELGKKSDTETLVDLEIKAGKREFEFITGKAFDKKLSFLEIDGKKISLDEKKNPYEKMFTDFFAGRKEDFPTIENAITAWKIIEKIEKSKPELKFYKQGISAEDFLTKN